MIKNPLKIFRYALIVIFVAALFVFFHSLDNVCKDIDAKCAEHCQLSLIRILKGIFYAVVFFWVTHYIVRYAGNYAKQFKIHPSNRVLIINFVSAVLYILAFLLFMQALKIDLTYFAFLSGAVIVGIGFGIQKIISNFISGVILLFDKSFQVGDLLQLDEKTYGYIRNTGTIYTVIETFDGREVMIPNETFITSRITNWTHSTKMGRLDVQVGISYSADLQLTQKLLIEAAREHPQCSKAKDVQCFLKEFGESCIYFQLCFWIDDVTKGRTGFRSDVMLNIAKKLKEHDIEIPYPQQTVRIIKK